MAKLFKKSSQKVGLPPGSLTLIGEKKTEKVNISLMDYDSSEFQEKELESIEEAYPCKDSKTVSWINLDGIHDITIVESVGNHFNIHPLILEDILHTGQRPKYEDFEDFIFVTLKMLTFDNNKKEIDPEQVSIILTSKCVITFQERKGDVFNCIRERIRKDKGRIRKMGTDYLFYSLIDAIVDNYFIILENIGETMEDMEEILISNPEDDLLNRIRKMRKEMIYLRKSVWPLRELISGLERCETILIDKTTGIYLRDVYDHTIQVIDTIESLRDMISGMIDVYLSSISNKMNEVMKVLTIFAAVFIPLTFIAGVYGMNFEYMPELKWHYGYFGVLGLMFTVGIGMVLYFKKKNWL